jgi:hypothetical protein
MPRSVRRIIKPPTRFLKTRNKKKLESTILSPISSTNVVGRPRLGSPRTSQDSNLCHHHFSGHTYH